MSISQLSNSVVRAISNFSKKLVRNDISRKVIALVVVLNFLIWPIADIVIPQLRTLASTGVSMTGNPVWSLSSLLSLLFGSATIPEDSLEDRLAQVAHLRISPTRLVAYEGERMCFSALATNYADQTIQGLSFTWESSNTSKVQIDDTGRADFLQPGASAITCHAGAVTATAAILIKPGRRPFQSDADWRAEQDNLSDTSSSGLERLSSSLLDSLAPTAYAQGGGYSGSDFGYAELWSDAKNLVGAARNRAVEATALGPVLPESSNFSFAVPLIGLGGRGMAANLTLYYNSRVWSRHGSAVTFSAVGGWPFAGFSLGFGRILTYGTSPNISYVLIDADGTRHFLGTGTPSTSAPFQTIDGTHITYDGSALHYSDGTKVTYVLYNNRLLPTQIADNNGNYVGVSYKYGVASPLAIDYVTDTQGRKIQFNYDALGNLISITAPGFGGTSQNPVTRTVAQFDYQAHTLSYSFTGLTVENAPTGQVQTLRHIYFPATGTGSLFSYSDYGMIYSLSNRRQMSIDGNGVISDGVENASETFNYPTLGSIVLTDVPIFTQRTESPGGSYSYATSTDGSGNPLFTITRPDSSTLLLTRSASSGLLLQSEIKSGSTSYSKTVSSYTTDPGGSTQVQSLVAYDDTGAQSKVDFDYDQYGNILNKREYGYQVSGAWQVQRRTHNTYKIDSAYINAYFRSLPIEVDVYDALANLNDADDVLIAKSTFIYDDYASTGGMTDPGITAKPPNWDASYQPTVTVRGNLTGTTQWTDVAANITLPTRLKKYDKFGNIVQEQVSCCKQKNFTYQSVDYWAKPQQVTDGNPAAVHLTGSYSYDFNTGLPKYFQTPNMGKINYYYDAALRLRQTDYPGMGSETATYNDGALSATFTKSGMGTTTVVYDGWGRTIQKTAPNNGQVNTSFDAMGRVQSQTNPFAAGGQPGPATTNQYDALGRATIITLPDNQTVQTAYSGSTITSTDPVGRRNRQQNDGLGRLIKVTEEDATGALTQDTNYSYNLLDKLTQVNQGNQIRSFKYDALGRLLYERIPEQSGAINDGTGTYWSCKYTYTDFSAVATKQDARGVITTYNYDGINRLTGVSYNTTNAPGVAATGGVGYTYDTNQSSATNGLLLSAGIENYSYDALHRLSSVARTIGSNTYATNYQYGAGALRSQVTYPSLRVVNINRDGTGRLTSLTDGWGANYLSGVSYNAANQVTGLTLGNGVTESYGYDSQRMQMTTQTATTSGGINGNLMNLTYNYQAAAGQSGAGTTAGNTGQLMTISNNSTINGAVESAAYTYDVLGRLVTSNQTSNGATVQRRFAFDRWGNRTGVWDAISGGTQIQSITLQQSGGAPSNQIQGVTTSGVTKNYSYDAAGNVTNDGTHAYIYDAENRLVSVDGGATASYSYDHNNRRISKTVGSVTTYFVWEGSQCIAEYDGNTGALQSEYIYSGSRIIAKSANGAMQYFLSDRLSERLVLDMSGNAIGRQAHLPFGEDFAESGTQEKHHFTSYERDDESGIDYAINRGYQSSVGRFNQADPYRASGYMVDPQSWNRYAYVQNGPVNAIDPTGLFLAAPQPTPSMDLWMIWWLIFGGPSTGSGGSGTSEPGGPILVAPPDRPEELRQQLKKALTNLGPGCTEFFGGKDVLQFRADEIGDWLRIVDPYSAAGNDRIPNAPGGIFSRPETYRRYWREQRTASTAAMTVAYTGHSPQEYNSIIYGDLFINPDSSSSIWKAATKGISDYNAAILAFQNLVLIHEYMHILNSMGDQDLKDKWVKEGGIMGNGDPSIELSLFIGNDCPKKK
jgi:RHS repeat-associated protein